MRKYLPHILIILFVFLLAPTALVTSYAGEVEDAREEVRNNPDDAKAHATLGLAYYNAGRHQEAIESYRQAIRINDSGYIAAVAWCGLGMCYGDFVASGLGKHQEAIGAFQNALSVDPNMDGAHCGLGLVYVLVNDKNRAIEQYKILKNLGSELANTLFDRIYKE